MPDNLPLMQRLLPYLAELPNDETTSLFWKSAEKGNVYTGFAGLLSLLSGEHRHRAYGIISAITGRSIRDIIRQPFSVMSRELLHALDEDTLLFCHMVSACGVRPIARVLYQYRPPCAIAIPELILMDRDNLKISIYACDMLRIIIGMFVKDASDIPTVQEVLGNTRKGNSAQQALEHAYEMLHMFDNGE